MTRTELYKELNYVNHSREKRLKYANLVIDHPELVTPLLDILFDVDDKISCRAAWVFEFMCKEKLEAIIPFLDVFTKSMSKVHLDPAVRPVAKVCEYLIKAHYSKTDNATKAYAMNSLFLLGSEYDWIHPELAIILERDFQMQSSGFKARARQILKKIRK